MARLQDKYKNESVPALKEKLGLKNTMLVPRLQKVVVNMGFGIVEKDQQKQIIKDLEAITGQKALLCKARKSIANFKLRDGMIIGAKVTLRGVRMYEFCDRLFNVTFPRIRDFRGVPQRGFDKRGNYTLGLKEHTVFPEITAHNAPDVGMDISFVTTATTDKDARALLEALGVQFAGK